MHIEVVRPFFISGQPHQPGEVLEVSDALGIELIGLRKAIGATPDAGKPARARKAKPDPEAE